MSQKPTRSPIKSLGLVLVILVGAVFLLAVMAMLMLAYIVHDVSRGTKPCAGLGRKPSANVVLAQWQLIDGQTVSQQIVVPPGARGIRVDARVVGRSPMPIFPDTVGLSVVEASRLNAALTQRDAFRAAQSVADGSAPTAPPSSIASPVGSGVSGINENVALTPGAYHLLTFDNPTRLGTVRVRVCQ